MSSLIRLSTVSDKEIVKLLESIDYIIFGIDGVLLTHKTLILGADKCVAKLRKLGKKVGFVTNNPASPMHALSHHLRHFDASEEEITMPNAAMISYLQNIGFDRDIYVVGGKLLKNMLKKAGYNVLEYKDIHDIPLEESMDAVKHLSGKTLDICKNVGAVILCNDVNFCLPAAQVAITILQNNDDVILLSGMSDDVAPLTDTFRIIGPKFYIEGIERWTNRKCIKIAKPGTVLKELLISKHEIVDPSRVLFVGDSVPIDIAFGTHCGFKTLLVLSGITEKHEVEEWSFAEEFKPDFIIQDLGSLFEKIKHI
ncbi:glycerol-3-phosphate phosphatase-like [Sitophilus oryzae]|uniref:Glycerol-3-phosphate phosphatase-like n=1 Tax=Sitophilus oryzae TaxID=7048 RepID=A0A6J2XCZ8_SITOR|nr:glycerol-3-phosphate phosphatase-like [Sitophilus oryzae]